MTNNWFTSKGYYINVDKIAYFEKLEDLDPMSNAPIISVRITFTAASSLTLYDISEQDLRELTSRTYYKA